ncbi:TonB-dependent receptor [Aquimarina sp. AD10]|uniref:TonB-dependent receptor n=1 Tax=Aquimarina sp. AD10 TaxID=1714849 RepID=UPI000E519992|nr:TonB-dependent receptor [Aquimarina sp. AD10]AXT63040.1 TonB-dependent receptor [Aquimarina sp. AD10]RKM96841.1 TonB-dependent receptor [Aquimarina sp. AD10]
MKKHTLCSVFLLMNLFGFSQSQSIVKGIVKENTTGLSISDVSVTVSQQNIGTSTNSDGEYSIRLPKGQYIIEFSAVGFTTVSKKIQLEEELQPLYVGLKRSETILSEIIIESDKEKEIDEHTVSKLSLKLRPITSAQDLLRTVPGLFIAQHAGGGKAEQIFLRGFDNDHGTDFAVFVDDIPINLTSHAHGQGYADLHFLIPETVGDASYYKGPHKTSIGNFGVSGAASYRTKSRLNKNLVKLEYGQYDYVRALGMVTLLDQKNFLTKNYENAYIAIEGTYNRSFFDTPQDLRRLNTFSKYTADINDTNTLVTSISTFHSDWNASGQIPLRAVQSGLIGRYGAIDDSEGGDTKRIHGTIQLSSELNENMVLNNQLYYVSNDFNLYSNFSFFQNDPVNGDMIHQFEYRNIFGYSGILSLKSMIGSFESKTKFGLGVQYNDNRLGLNRGVRRVFLESVNRFRVKETNYSLYAEELLHINERFRILMGLRGDYFNFDLEDILPVQGTGNENAFRLSPKFSVYYDIAPNVQLYAKASSGFHSNYTQTVIKDPSIDPLPKAVGYDLGVEFKIGKHILTNLTGWYIQSDAEFVFITDSPEFENRGRSERVGGDLSLHYQPRSYLWFDTNMNYSYGTLLDEPQEANKIPSAPRFTSTGGITLKLPNGIKSSLRYRYLAERPLLEDESVSADAYFLGDFVMNYTKPKYEIGLSIENIFNQDWVEAIFYDASQLQGEAAPVDDFHFTPGTPFSAKLSLTYFF